MVSLREEIQRRISGWLLRSKRILTGQSLTDAAVRTGLNRSMYHRVENIPGYLNDYPYAKLVLKHLDVDPVILERDSTYVQEAINKVENLLNEYDEETIIIAHEYIVTRENIARRGRIKK